MSKSSKPFAVCVLRIASTATGFALSPVIGYDKSSAIAHKANDEGTTLREAAVASGYISDADFDRIVKPAAMVGAVSA